MANQAANQPLTYDSANLVIPQWIAPGSSVLDVGCATGRLGALLAPECDVTGIEFSKDAAEIARNRGYSSVFCHDLNAGFPDLEGRRFDAIVFADVLEHLVDPSRLLVDARSHLRPGGKVLVSLPNIANWQIRMSLLAGRWEYADTGILDRTHLRFYTLASARRFIEESGYAVTRFSTHNARLRLLGKLWPTFFSYQFVFEAAPR